MLAIYKREVRSYFQSMVGCVFVAFLIAFTGIYFMAYNLTAGYPYFSYTLSGTLIVFIVGIPLITMRSFSEERKNKTDQLLLTAPVSLWKVVLGKYLAMVTVIGIPNVIFCAFPLIIKAQGTAYLKVDYISIGVFFLLGCVYAAIGMFLSALTESQMIAFISTFGILLILYLWNGILSMLPSSAVSGLVGVLIILTLIVVYIYQMTGNIVIAGVIEAVGVIAGVVVYFVKSSLYENLLTKMLGRLALADVFTDITSKSIVYITVIALYLSLFVVFVFLPVQAIMKVDRRKKTTGKIKGMFHTSGTKHGSYSVGLTVLVIAIVIVFNLVIGQIPEAYRNLDMSSTKIYEISDTTKDLLSGLNDKVDMKVLAVKKDTDDRIKTFISKYAALSDKINIEWIDPVVPPLVWVSVAAARSS